jgi:hypothetical protein
MMVLSMLIFGGETLHYFALALTIGICFGIYSSVLVASPLVMWLGVSREQFIKPKKPEGRGGGLRLLRASRPEKSAPRQRQLQAACPRSAATSLRRRPRG